MSGLKIAAAWPPQEGKAAWWRQNLTAVAATVAFVSGLMAQRVPLIRLRSWAGMPTPFMMHRYAALARKSVA